MKTNSLFAKGAPAGWQSLVDPLIERCNAEGVQILQVKEKFGGLRFYTGGGESPALTRAIEDAEAASKRICEVCGQPGYIRGARWLRALCDDHSGEAT